MTMSSDTSKKTKPATETTAPKAAEPTPIKPPATAPTAPKAAETAPADTDTEETKEKARRGIVPTMPMAVLYRRAGRVHAVIHHPIDGTSYEETGKGEGSAKGSLEDTGFRLSSITSDGPAWLVERVPADVQLIGYASIKSFPLPPQT
jgi:hypothetical protein